MKIHVRDVRFFVLPMRTRFPFRYGIASMTEVPHLFVRAELEVDGTVGCGISSEGLPPKWFTKNPESSFEDDDLPEMYRVILHAADLAIDAGRCNSYFDWWRAISAAQSGWSADNGIAPLLGNLGTSLVERAVLDAVCRATQRPIDSQLRENTLGVRLSDVRPELARFDPGDALADQPLRSVAIRHTVGLGDPLTDADISDADRVDDGLPQSLTASIRAYGLRYFKVKLSGNELTDRERLQALSHLFQSEVPNGAKFTLDGNENFPDIGTFRAQWDAHRCDPQIQELIERGLLFVEQPLHRDQALADSVRTELTNWPDAPPIIIDESDAELSSLPRALELGYSGTSHKNCKGIVKGLANAALVKQRHESGHVAILSGEDLGNVGPITLLHDFAMIASLGIKHVERNAHHYFRGLSMYPDDVQQSVLKKHGDLYIRHNDGFPMLNIVDGAVDLASVVSAPFGFAQLLNVEQFEEIDLTADQTDLLIRDRS
ncbi:MAG: hypothetical protein ACYTGL_10450 [Planctomycetota bacterium]|jgi:hypothetical protein